MPVVWTKSNEQQGVGVTYIHAGKDKVDENSDSPLDNEAKAEMQRHVDWYYGMFVTPKFSGPSR